MIRTNTCKLILTIKLLILPLSILALLLFLPGNAHHIDAKARATASASSGGKDNDDHMETLNTKENELLTFNPRSSRTAQDLADEMAVTDAAPPQGGFEPDAAAGGGAADQKPDAAEPKPEAAAGGGAADQKAEAAATNFKGKFDIFKEDAAISAMHMILLPIINKVLIFDSTIWLISKIRLPPGSKCHPIKDRPGEVDCWAHSALMDAQTGELTPLLLMTDTWCSSGALAIDGSLVSTGGYQAGANSARYLANTPNAKWREYNAVLASERWYSTQVTLGDGRFMVFGGRNFQTYEYVPAEGQKNQAAVPFPFLKDTLEPFENNLYPFVYLAPDGNLFVFANNRSVLLDPNANKVVHEFPILPGGSRNYPAGGASTVLPIMLNPNDDRQVVPTEVLICGGAPHDAYYWANEIKPKKFVPANNDCGRIDITKRDAQWTISQMPSARVMGDAMILPSGDVLLINGAKQGSAGWDNARDPNLIPVLYQTRKQGAMVELHASFIPRMYHSTAAIMPDAKVLVAGSNSNNGYIYDSLFPTELRVEKFSPPYLDPALAPNRPQILVAASAPKITYGKPFNVQAKMGGADVDAKTVEVVIYSPPFTTHGVSMNQRLVNLGVISVKPMGPGTFDIQVSAPQHGSIAPPGYYMIFVNKLGVPSESYWIQLTK